jgi:hypothetical protein
MAAQGFTLMAPEALFHGTGPNITTSKGLSAEEFADQTAQSITAANLVGAQAVAYAIRNLRDYAYSWYHSSLPITRPAERAQAVTDPDVFWRLFKDEWFTVRSTVDVGTKWATLTRMDGETPSQFIRRASEVMHDFKAHMAPIVVANNTFDAYTAAKVAHRAACVTAGGNNADPAVVAAATAETNAFRAAFTVCIDGHHDALMARILLKVIGAGVRHHKMREIVRAEETNFISLHHVVEKVKEAEKSFDLPYWRRPHNNTNNQNIVDAEEDSEDDESGVEAVRKTSKMADKKKAKKQRQAAAAAAASLASAAQQQQQHTGGNAKKDGKKRTRWDFTKPPPLEAGPCRNCGKAGLHWRRDCPNRDQSNNGDVSNRGMTNPWAAAVEGTFSSQGSGNGQARL